MSNRQNVIQQCKQFLIRHSFIVVAIPVVAIFGFLVWCGLSDSAFAVTQQNAAKNTSGTGRWVVNILALIIYHTVFRLSAFLASITGALLDTVVMIESFDVPVVQIGWQVVRDLCNMGFILVLLVISFGTIFRIQAYSAKQLLPKLILGALLINFSKTISFVIINLSQILMRAFLAPFGFGAGAGLAKHLNLEQAALVLSTGQATFPDTVNSDMLIGLIFGTVFLAVAAFVFFVYAIVLIVRVVALWILVALSPAAYVLNIIPGKPAEMAKTWWREFINYSICGPIIAFFLYLALVTATTVQNITLGGGRKILDVTSTTNVQNALAGSMTKLLQFVFVIAFLIAGIIAAKKICGIAGEIGIGAGKRTKNLGMGAVRWGAGKTWGGLKKSYGGLRRVTGLEAGAAARKQLRDERAEQKRKTREATYKERRQLAADKRAQTRVGRLVNWAKGVAPRTAQKRFADQSQQMGEQFNKLKDEGITNMDQLVPIISADAQSDDAVKRRNAQGAMMMVAQNGQQEMFTAKMTQQAMDPKSDQYKSKWAQDVRKMYKDKYGIDDAGLQAKYAAGDLEVDPSDFGGIVQSVYGYPDGDPDKQVETANLMGKLENTAFASGNMAYTGTTQVDSDGTMKMKIDPKTQLDKSVSQFKTKGTDKGVEQLRPDMLATRKIDPKSGKIVNDKVSDLGKEILTEWSAGHTFNFKTKGSPAAKEAIRDLWKNDTGAVEDAIRKAMVTGNRAVGEMVAQTISEDITVGPHKFTP